MKEQIAGNIEQPPAEDLEVQARSVLQHAVDAQRKGLKIYESLQNLNEVIGTEYGDRVLYELIQNAHDAHDLGDEGRIAIKLVVKSETEGILYVANGGRGFRKKDVEAIENLATTAKKVGEGIGNKGLGFRSVEALTDDVRIYSRRSTQQTDCFDGYCFRFAKAGEIEDLLRRGGIDATTSREVASTVPRYLVPRPLMQHPDEVASYARRDYATVIAVPLGTAESVELARRQVRALADLNVPLLLFLDRITEIRIDIETPDQQPYRRRLHRHQTVMDTVPALTDCQIYEVGIGEGRRFLIVRREVDRERVRDAVGRSIPKASQLKRWLDWKGQPIVSVAVGLSKDAVTKGRLYNFLPMGEEAESPLTGYLDAPFFTAIDRRNADLEMPLNETLMEAAAEACVVAALSIIKQDIRVPQRAVFDLVAWTGDQAEKLDDALEEAGSSLYEAPFIPSIAVEDRKGWASLTGVSIWPEGALSLLKAKEVAKRAGAQLVSEELDACRLDRLKEIAEERTCESLLPSDQCLAEWLELFAYSMVERKGQPRTWSRFYEDVNQIFDKIGGNLKALAGKSILCDRSGKLHPAGGHGSATTKIFARREGSKGKRVKEGVPLPPATLTRRYRFLDEKISIRQKTLDAFIEADLIHEYDPMAALSELKSVLGKGANDSRRREALSWAFRVWQTVGDSIKEELRSADLYVPAWTGWQPATHATFSASWTRMGKALENFLVGAADISPDCRRARNLLLTGFQDWPVRASETKQQWIRFLELIGVTDGLRPVAARVWCSKSGDWWNYWLSEGETSEGLDEDWRVEVKRVSFKHPYTDYQRKGEAWRLPGQLEHEELPETAKEEFCTLAFKHLEAQGTKFFAFEVGRFERYYQREWDRQILPTPLATFLRSKPWIAVNTQEGAGFRRASECWAARTRRGSPPRFMDRVFDQVAGFAEDEEFAELSFGENLGLRDWQSPDTAVERLGELASTASALTSHDRPAFRREYRRAWVDVVETGVSLPANLSLAVNCRSQLQELSADAESPPKVIVTQDAQRFEARTLSLAGQAVLDVGDASIKKVTTLLDATDSFTPRPLDGIGVQLLVNGEPFVPSASDPPLTSLGLSWLPEVAVLGYELLGEQLERGIQRDTVDRRVRAIRIRSCEKIALMVDDAIVSPTERMNWYAFEDETLPTLILTDALSLNWQSLARLLSEDISRLIDRRLRSLERLLLRLSGGSASDALDAPSDEALAEALRCGVRMVQDQRAALRTDLGHILHLLMPVVAYFKGADLAHRFESDADRAGANFDVADWLRAQLTDASVRPEDLIDACEEASDRVALRRRLNLDYERFNRALVKTGESPLSNEADLRQLYEAYLSQMRPIIIERLRQHHAADFRNERDLTSYVERKTLAFLPFDPQWVLTREALETEVVEAHVFRLLDETLGEDQAVDLLELGRLIERNRKSVREFAVCAVNIVRVWCRRNEITVPEPWQNDDPQSVARYLENAGLLDFEPVSGKQVLALCRRAGCWPSGMPETLDGTTLGLNQTEVEGEEDHREQERQQREIERRSIEFAGRSLDTGDPSFAYTLQQMAKDHIVSDDAWFERSRQRTRLVEFNTADQSRSGSGHQGGKTEGARRRQQQLTDSQRRAMGLASEWLAFQFLCRSRHKEFVDETCWISENRTHFFGGNKGNDAAGYDFRVKTPQAEWLYEVKSSLEDPGEFELTANELSVASSASKDGRRRYRILYVPFVFSPERWSVLELPNPMGDTTHNRFTIVGRGSVRLRFERR